MKKSNSLLVGLMCICVVAFFAFGIMLGTLISGGSKGTVSRIEDEIARIIREESLFGDNNLKGERLLHAKLNGLLASMDDPYADILYKDESIVSSITASTGMVKRIGISYLFATENLLFVTNITNENLLGKIYPGDFINGVYIDGEKISFRNMPQAEIANYLSLALESSTVGLSLYRDGTEMQVIVTPYLTEYSTATSKMLNATQGYLQLTEFAEGSALDFAEALAYLENMNMQELVLDLRNNPGGYLSEFDDIVQLLVPYSESTSNKGIVFRTLPSNSKTAKIFVSGNKNLSVVYDITVLVNENTASAAECLAGVLKEQIGATIRGNATYGKDIYQNTVRIKGTNYYLKYTEGYWEYFKPSIDKFTRLEFDPILTEFESENIKDYTTISPIHYYGNFNLNLIAVGHEKEIDLLVEFFSIYTGSLVNTYSKLIEEYDKFIFLELGEVANGQYRGRYVRKIFAYYFIQRNLVGADTLLVDVTN